MFSRIISMRFTVACLCLSLATECIRGEEVRSDRNPFFIEQSDSRVVHNRRVVDGNADLHGDRVFTEMQHWDVQNPRTLDLLLKVRRLHFEGMRSWPLSPFRRDPQEVYLERCRIVDQKLTETLQANYVSFWRDPLVHVMLAFDAARVSKDVYILGFQQLQRFFRFLHLLHSTSNTAASLSTETQTVNSLPPTSQQTLNGVCRQYGYALAAFGLAWYNHVWIVWHNEMTHWLNQLESRDDSSDSLSIRQTLEVLCSNMRSWSSTNHIWNADFFRVTMASPEAFTPMRQPTQHEHFQYCEQLLTRRNE